MPAGIVIVAVLSGCPDEETPPGDDDGPPGCELPFLGDASQDPSIELIYFGADEKDHPVTNGGTIDLILPPQGGRVLFVGVRVTDVDPCGVRLTGALRERATGQVRFDTRTVNLRDAGDGLGASTPGDIASYANIPICPNQWTARDTFDESFELEVAVEDSRGRSASKLVEVVPICAQAEHEAECLCICKGGYVLGEQCVDPNGSGGGGAGGSSDGGGGA